MGEEATGQNQVADAGSAEIESFGHVVVELPQVTANDLAHGVEDFLDENGFAGDDPIQSLPEPVLVAGFRKPVGEQFENRWIAAYALVGQGHDAVSQIPHRRHVEGPSEHRRTAAGIKRCHHMDGIVRVSDDLPAESPQRRASGKKQDLRPQFGSPAIERQPARVGHVGPAGHGDSARHGNGSNAGWLSWLILLLERERLTGHVLGLSILFSRSMSKGIRRACPWQRDWLCYPETALLGGAAAAGKISNGCSARRSGTCAETAAQIVLLVFCPDRGPGPGRLLGLRYHSLRIDDQVVFAIFRKRLGDFDLFSSLIKAWLRSRENR